jgi:nitroimidazol reductase NimA-like FMN-containing flavoprotein (pyridoxamine 5'-phosphate oxidase superfamily)
MRRKERKITDIDEKLKIIEKCKVCRLGLSENNYPYIIPLNYGFSYEDEKLTLYFHGAADGKKMDIIKKNNNACFEIDCDTKLIEGELPCNYSYEYKSIIGFGKIIILETKDKKIDALNYLMKHQTGKNIKYDFNENKINSIAAFKMVVEEFTGKQKV